MGVAYLEDADGLHDELHRVGGALHALDLTDVVLGQGVQGLNAEEANMCDSMAFYCHIGMDERQDSIYKPVPHTPHPAPHTPE